MKLLDIHEIHRWNGTALTRIVEFEGEAIHHSVLFPGRTADEIRRVSPPGEDSRLTETGMIVTSTQFFLLQGGGHTAVIEAGSGNGKPRPDEPYWDRQNLPYAETLASLGVRPEDVDFVFLSHLHQDHVGLATTAAGAGWAPTFPRARYVLNPREWEYWSRLPAGHPKRHPCIDDSVRPLADAGRIRFAVDGELIAGIRIHETPGHTPGHLIFEAESAGLWFLGDLLHHPAQAAHPDWPSADWDVDRAGGIAQRNRFFRRFADSDALLLGSHLGGLFRIEEVERGEFRLRFDQPAESRGESCGEESAAG
jgi:glyoxylase-like metal-dependent hydrolase (beta-lactamase superfamily II)